MDGQAFASSEAVFDFCMRYVNVEKGEKTELKLDRMRELCRALGDPQDSYRSLHVAGSKGKGSVSAMAARMLEAAGFRTGLYTSPHLLRWKERMSLAGEELGEEPILAAAEALRPFVEGRGAADFAGGVLPTYFELTTLVAFEAFRRVGCARAVLETGLGGRLDSTNVVDSAASIITPIELEHTEWLGDTIPLIAFEKAGIIKPGKPCYLSRQLPEARAVFASVARERGSPLREAPLLVEVGEVAVDRRGTSATLRLREPPAGRPEWAQALRARTPLVGAVQAENMALALLAAAETEPALDPAAALRGLARASLPARFEILALDPPVVLDGAHTPASAGYALESFSSLFPGRGALLFACAIDKHHAEMAGLLARRFARVTVTRPGGFKQSDAEAVFRSFRAAGAEAVLVEDTAEAVRTARAEAAAAGMPLLVTGSFYLCAEAARILR